MSFLKNNVLSVGEAAGAANTTALTSEIVDMSGFDTVTFIALTGDVTSGCVLGLNIEHGDVAAGSDMADTTINAAFTAGASDADSKILAVELHKPTKRYARAVLTRTTQNAVVGGIIAIQSEPSKAPVTQDATVIDHEIGISSPSA
jgi:hypothetical protein